MGDGKGAVCWIADEDGLEGIGIDMTLGALGGGGNHSKWLGLPNPDVEPVPVLVGLTAGPPSGVPPCGESPAHTGLHHHVNVKVKKKRRFMTCCRATASDGNPSAGGVACSANLKVCAVGRQ